MKNDRRSLVGPASRWDEIQRFQIRFLKDQGLKPEHYLIDIGCGVLRGGVPLINYLEPSHYYGVESRSEALDEGRKELRENNLQHKEPNLINRDTYVGFSLPVQFDFAWAYSVLFHMPDNIVNDCFEFLAKQLREGGVFFANVRVGKRVVGKWREFPNHQRPLTWYENAADSAGLSCTAIGTVEDWGLKGVKDVKNKPILRMQRC